MEENKITRKKLLDRLAKKKNMTNFADVLSVTSSLMDREFAIAEIDEDTGEVMEAVIRYWNKLDDEQGFAPEERTPIKIYINSPGGSLYSTFTVIDAIKMSKTPVYTINTGMAFSGGFLIFISGHKRFAYSNSTFLFHEGSTGGGLTQDAGKFRNYAAYYEKLLKKIEKITLTYTKISEEEYLKHKLDDWWMLSEEAINLGVCDEIINNFI